MNSPAKHHRPTVFMCLHGSGCADKPGHWDTRGFTLHDEVLGAKNCDRLRVCGDLRRPFVCMDKS